MSYCLVFTGSYSKRAAKWLKRYPDLRQQYLKTLQLLELNPFTCLIGSIARHPCCIAQPDASVNASAAGDGRRDRAD